MGVVVWVCGWKGGGAPAARQCPALPRRPLVAAVAHHAVFLCLKWLPLARDCGQHWGRHPASGGSFPPQAGPLPCRLPPLPPHPPPTLAAGDKNEEHFFVATQDKALQRKCMAVPGGAVLFASVNGVHMEQPSELQKQTVAQVGGPSCCRGWRAGPPGWAGNFWGFSPAPGLSAATRIRAGRAPCLALPAGLPRGSGSSSRPPWLPALPPSPA